MKSIKLYEKQGWVDTIRGLEQFGIVPEIRAQGTISKGYSTPQRPVSLEYFLVHTEPEPTEKTQTLPELLACYGVKQEELKMLHVSIPSPNLSFKTGRFKYGKKSGVLCSSDDNVIGTPLMDLRTNDIVLEQGSHQECKSCPFAEDGSCKETVLVLFSINAPSVDISAPFGAMLFKMTLPRTARNPFFGDYALAMGTAYNAVLRYGLDHQHFPQALIPFTLALVLRRGQYFNKETKSQTKTTYYVPQLKLDEQRLYALLERFAAQFGGRQLYAPPSEIQLSSEVEPFSEDLIEKGRKLAGQIEAFGNGVKGIRTRFDTLLESRIQKKGEEEVVIASNEDLQEVLDEMASLLQKKQQGVLQELYKTTKKFIAEHQKALLEESEKQFGETFDFDAILSDMVDCVNGAGKFIGQSFEDRREGLQEVHADLSHCLIEKEETS